MSALLTHDLEDIVAMQSGGTEAPGNMVRHVNDAQSVGVVVAHDPRPQGFSKQPQVTVLWSREPILINVSVQTINAKSRPLRAKRSVKKEATVYGGGPDIFNSKLLSRPELEGEEEYGPGDLDDDQLRELSVGSDEVEMHSDGRVVVKRRAHEPPEYLRGSDGTVRSTYRR